MNIDEIGIVLAEIKIEMLSQSNSVKRIDLHLAKQNGSIAESKLEIAKMQVEQQNLKSTVKGFQKNEREDVRDERSSGKQLRNLMIGLIITVSLGLAGLVINLLK